MAPNLQSLLKRPSEKLKDYFEGHLFDTMSFVPLSDNELVENFELPLVHQFLDLATEITEEPRSRSFSDKLRGDEIDGNLPSTQNSDWKTVRSKLDVTVQKKRIIDADTGYASELYRASVPIACDMDRTFTVIIYLILDLVKSKSF